MLLKLTIAFVAAVCLSAAGASYASQVDDIAAALDNAASRDEIVRQVAALESLAEKPSPPAGTGQQLGRALYLLGEGEKDKKGKLEYLKRSLAVSEKALKEYPDDSRALYWKDMALLLEADAVGGFKALSDVKKAIRELETVSQKEPKYDSAGAYRSWGKVLIEAPEWSLIGDKKKGLQLLQKANELAPESLVNRLYLAQAYLRNGLKGNALKELQYIVSAPARKGDRDAANTKEEARKLLKEDK